MEFALLVAILSKSESKSYCHVFYGLFGWLGYDDGCCNTEAAPFSHLCLKNRHVRVEATGFRAEN